MTAKLFSQLTDFAPGCHQLNHLLAKFRRVRPLVFDSYFTPLAEQ